MSLIMCPECGKAEVSDRAISCPNCGFPIASYYKNSAEVSGKVSSYNKDENKGYENKYTIFKIGTEDLEISDYSLALGKIEKEIESIARTIPVDGIKYFSRRIIQNSEYVDGLKEVIFETISYSERKAAKKCIEYLINNGIFNISDEVLVYNLIDFNDSEAKSFLDGIDELTYYNYENAYEDFKPIANSNHSDYFYSGLTDNGMEAFLGNMIVAAINDTIDEAKRINNEIDRVEREKELQNERAKILNSDNLIKRVFYAIYFRCMDYTEVIKTIMNENGIVPRYPDKAVDIFMEDQDILVNITSAYLQKKIDRMFFTSELKRMIKNYALFPDALMSFLYLDLDWFSDIKKIFELLGIERYIVYSEVYNSVMKKEFYKLKNLPSVKIQEIDEKIIKLKKFENYYGYSSAEFEKTVKYLESRREELEEKEKRNKQEDLGRRTYGDIVFDSIEEKNSYEKLDILRKEFELFKDKKDWFCSNEIESLYNKITSMSCPKYDNQTSLYNELKKSISNIYNDVNSFYVKTICTVINYKYNKKADYGFFTLREGIEKRSYTEEQYIKDRSTKEDDIFKKHRFSYNFIDNHLYQNMVNDELPLFWHYIPTGMGEPRKIICYTTKAFMGYECKREKIIEKFMICHITGVRDGFDYGEAYIDFECQDLTRNKSITRIVVPDYGTSDLLKILDNRIRKNNGGKNSFD